jgi:hypothetical protein
MLAMSEDQRIADVLTRLVSQHPSYDPADIAQAVSHARERFAASRVRDFVPLLVERQVRSELSVPRATAST